MEGEMSTAITHYEGSSAIMQWREPEEVLAQATKAAVALKKVMDNKPNKVMFNNEQYLEREDWGTVANFYNCTAKSVETRPLQLGDVVGFEAVAVVIDRTTGVEIGRAESMCLSDEENWGKVPKYEWKDKLDAEGRKIWNPKLRNGKGGYEAEKIKVGETQKPLFQLRSMAQTRAEAKALKGVFSWVVVLAGYKPTPAEELTGHEDFGDPRPPKEPVQQPQRASEVKKQQEAQQSTQAQQQPTQGQQKTQSASGDEVQGLIETAKESKSGDGTVWLSTKGGLVMVPADKVDGDMKPGYFIKCKGVKKHSDKVGEYHIFTALIELSPVQEGDTQQPVTAAAQQADQKTAPMAEDASKVADELFGKQEPQGQAAVQSMVDNGTLKPASQVQAPAKPGTIGLKRAKRLYAIAGQNKKTTGFTEENIKKVLAALPIPLEHLSDLEVGMYEDFEKFCTGESDWSELLKDE
jgi:hypothetical protein